MILAVDTETTGTDFFHGCKPFMITACDGTHNYIWSGKINPYNRAEVVWNDDDLDEVQELLASASTLVLHNAKFDIRALSTIGINWPYWNKTEDTSIASHVCCSGEKHGLKYLAFKYLNYSNEGQTELQKAVKSARLRNKHYDIAKEGHPTMPGAGGPGTKWYAMDYWLEMDLCAKYGLDDVEMTWGLWEMYKDVMQSSSLYPLYEKRKALLPITYQMQSHGMNMYADKVSEDIVLHKALRKTLSQKIQKECHILTKLDFDREQDVQFFLFDVLKLEVLKRSEKTNKPSINKETVQTYVDSNPTLTPLQHFADYRKCGTKIGYLSSYLKWVDGSNRIHSDLLITGTRETRQSSRNPNTQNIDKSLKGIFGPPRGKVWLVYDLVNIELRIWGYEVGNKELTSIFDQKKSFHAEIANTLYPKISQICKEENESFKQKYGATYYQWVKNGNFCIIYGGSERKANETYKCVDESYILGTSDKPKTKNAYKEIVGRFPEVPDFTASKIQEVFDNEAKYGVPFITCKGGYRLDVPIEQVYTKACNYFCQGSAGYIIGLAMIEVDKNPNYISTKSQMVNQVHDSLYIEVNIEHNTPSLQKSLKRSIEAGGELLLPTCEAELEAVIYHPEENPNE